MPMILYRRFGAEVPRIEPELLSNERAQLARDCVFETGVLGPTRAGVLFRTMQSNPVRGLFTLDGNLFYSWPVETQAFRAPIINDEFNRMYFLQPGGTWRVASTVGMATDGPQPSQSWRAGVPRPPAAPRLSLVDRTSLPDYPNVTIKAKTWIVDSYGDKSHEGEVSLTPVTPFKSYTFTPHELPAHDELDKPVLYMRFTITDDDNDDNLVLAVTVRLSDYEVGGTSDRVTSTSVPGSVEGWMVGDGSSTYEFHLQWGFEATRAYTYTYRNTWEEEGMAAEPASIEQTYLQDVLVEVDPGDFTGYRPFLEYQVYRTYGGNGTYIEVDTTQVTTTTFLDETHGNTGAMGAALESVDWIPAPDALSGVVQSPNGWFAAFKGSTVYMSQPYYPHAWPYYQTFPTAVRGIAVGQGVVVVTTADGVYVLIGSHPAAIQQEPLTLPQPGIAQRSMVNIDGSVAYASQDGIMLVNGTTATSALNEKLFTREIWRARYSASLDDASLMFNYHDGVLVAASRERASGFLLRTDEDVGAFTRYDRQYDAMFRLPISDALFYSIGDTLYRFQAGAAETFDWWGKDWVLPGLSNLSAGFIRCDGPIKVMVYADGVLKGQKTVTSGYFRVPGTKTRHLRWSVRLQGSSKVREFALATSRQELIGA